MELISLMHKSAKINCTKISTSKNYYIKNFVLYGNSIVIGWIVMKNVLSMKGIVD